MDRQTNGDKWTDRQMDRQSNGQTDKWKVTQMDRQTNGKTDK